MIYILHFTGCVVACDRVAIKPIVPCMYSIVTPHIAYKRSCTKKVACMLDSSGNMRRHVVCVRIIQRQCLHACDHPQDNQLSDEHAGFIMALGMLGHLQNISAMSIYNYLTKGHDTTSVGVLLGMAAAAQGRRAVATRTHSTQRYYLLLAAYWS